MTKASRASKRKRDEAWMERGEVRFEKLMRELDKADDPDGEAYVIWANLIQVLAKAGFKQQELELTIDDIFNR